MKKYLDYDGLSEIAEFVNSKEPRIFKGTQAQWDALSTAEKKTFGTAGITDDESATETALVKFVTTNTTGITQAADSFEDYTAVAPNDTNYNWVATSAFILGNGSCVCCVTGKTFANCQVIVHTGTAITNATISTTWLGIHK